MSVGKVLGGIAPTGLGVLASPVKCAEPAWCWKMLGHKCERNWIEAWEIIA